MDYNSTVGKDIPQSWQRFQVLSTFNLRTSISPFSDSFGVFVALESIHRMGAVWSICTAAEFVRQLPKLNSIECRSLPDW